jgi:hypothetical protein
MPLLNCLRIASASERSKCLVLQASRLVEHAIAGLFLLMQVHFTDVIYEPGVAVIIDVR